MTDRLTPEHEAEIVARLKAAVGGPWRVDEDQRSLNRFVVDEDGLLVINFGYVGNRTRDVAEFVAHARIDVPALLAELVAVRAERDEIAARVRSEIADDVHRAALPAFAATENPELAAKTVRAVDVRLIAMGYAAPYFVAKGGTS